MLHRVTRDGGAALDSVRTDPRGGFRFRLPSVDTTAIYLVSAEWQGIGYFSSPARLLGRPRDTLPALTVYDTSAAGPPPVLLRRLVSFARLGQGGDGSWDVLEAMQVENRSRTTRVSTDSARPTWTWVLPPGAIQFQAADGDISPEAIARRGDSVAVFGAIAPGAIRQLTVTYRLPANQATVTIPIDQATSALELLIEGEGADVAVLGGERLETVGAQEVEGRTFTHFRSAALAAGTSVLVTLPRAPRGPQTLVAGAVVAIGLLLAAGLWVAFGRPRAVAGAAPGR